MLEARLDRISLWGAIFVAGYVTCAGVNHVKDLWSQHGQLQMMKTQVVPKLAAEVNCQKKRADINAVVAKQAIKGALADDAPIPSEHDVLTGCPKPKR